MNDPAERGGGRKMSRGRARKKESKSTHARTHTHIYIYMWIDHHSLSLSVLATCRHGLHQQHDIVNVEKRIPTDVSHCNANRGRRRWR